MIHRKRILISIIVAAICLFSSAASANWTWYECTVTHLGVGGNRYEFRLSGNTMYGGSPSVINSWYEIYPDCAITQKEVLVIVLTAISLGKTVEVLLEPGVVKSIYAIYLKN